MCLKRKKKIVISFKESEILWIDKEINITECQNPNSIHMFVSSIQDFVTQ